MTRKITAGDRDYYLGVLLEARRILSLKYFRDVHHDEVPPTIDDLDAIINVQKDLLKAQKAELWPKAKAKK